MHKILLTALTLLIIPGTILAQELAAQIDALIPKLADENIEARYAPQMAFRDLASVAGRPGAEAERKAFVGILLERLASDKTPQPVKVWFVRELEHIAKGESVDTLGKLLASDDVELREVARRALEKNSDPAASKALLGAMERHDVVWQSGVLNALGERRADDATPSITALLGDAELQSAAASALGHIASKESVAALHGAWDGAEGPFRQALCNAMVEASYRLPEVQANDLCDFLFNAPETPVATRIAAWTRNYLANPTYEDLLAGVQHQNLAISGAAVRAAAGDEASTVKLANAMARMDKTVQVRILGLLGDQGTPEAAVDALVNASESGDADIRRAAIRAMETSGGANIANALLKYAAAGDRDARRALTKLQGDEAQAAINAAIRATGDTDDPKIRVAAINTLTDRNVPDASGLLIQILSDEKNADVSRAAMGVLGKIASGKDIPPLIQLSEKNPRAIGSLRNAANRASDKAAATQAVLGSLAKFDGKARAAMLKVLPVLGDEAGMKALAEAGDGDAMRALAEWPDGRAVPALLENARNAELSDGEHVTIVRGIIRLLPGAKMKPETKVANIGDLLAAARNQDIRKQVVTLYGDIAHPSAAAPLVDVIQKGAFKDEANLAALKLGEVLLKQKKKDPVASLATAILETKPTGELEKKAKQLQKRAK